MEIAIRRGDGSLAKTFLTPENVDPPNSGFANASIFSAMIDNREAGQFKFSRDKTEWLYEGELSSGEQTQIAQFIQAFRANK
jgi:hypothetical protein